jgi:hypothetical protein
MSLPKPPHGQPCNSCGKCCSDELCPLAMRLFGRPFQRRCPALEPDGDRLVCGLIAHPMAYAMARTLANGVENMRKAACHLVGAGRGCDAQLATEPADEAFRARMWADRNERLTSWSLKQWGVTR